MKKMFLSILLIPLLLCGCNKKQQQEEVVPEQKQYINVALSEVSLHEEEQYQIEVEILQKGTIVFYTSNDNNIASVDNNGLIQGVKAGETTISIRGGKDSYTLFVTVLPYQTKDSLQIVLLKNEFTLQVNDEYELPLTVKYGNTVIENPTLSYVYETEDIVTISSLTVSAKKAGTTQCVVTATYNEE